ncbi:MAG: type II toxin-antitoxin system Phd/YefM family antitoxin [Actinomycetia bacterium]|nr:type II toxin-antitoxin system Phd/YefM family antitoxin [Actinomycetes bacterium]
MITATQARQTLPAQLDKVERGAEVEITRHGRVVAVLVSPAALVSRRASRAWCRADQIGALLDQARRKPLPEPTMSASRADELVSEVRAGRRDR